MPKKPPKDDRDLLVFPKALRNARKAAGFRTQEVFAEACSVHIETVGRYERGDQAPSEDTVRHMVEKLRAKDPHADLAALERAAEQDRRVLWHTKPMPVEYDELSPFLAFELLRRMNPTAADLLRLCAFLAPDAIPVALLTTGDSSSLGDRLASVVRNHSALNGILEVLRNLSLIQWIVSGRISFWIAVGELGENFVDDRRINTLSLPRLVQTMVADQMSEAEQREWIGRCIRLLALGFPNEFEGEGHGTIFGLPYGTSEYDQWCEQLLPHVRKMVELETAWDLHPNWTIGLFEHTAEYLFRQRQKDEAEALYHHAFSLRNQQQPPERPPDIGGRQRDNGRRS